MGAGGCLPRRAPSSGGQALRRVPQDRGQQRGFSWQPGASCPGKRDTLGCGHSTAWISALSWPSVTVLWLAGHAEQTRFTQPALWWALLRGSGTSAGNQARLWGSTAASAGLLLPLAEATGTCTSGKRLQRR